MTRSMLSTRDARVLALGAAVVITLLGIGRGVPMLLARTADRRQSATSASQRAARAEWSAQNAESTRRTLDRIRTQLVAYDSALVEGATPSAASAALAELVSNATSDADARLGSIQLTADTLVGRGALARVTARVSVSGDLMSIAQLLQMLEEGPQLLAVREVNLVQSQPGVAHGQPETLQVELLVEGLFRRPPARGAR